MTVLTPWAESSPLAEEIPGAGPRPGDPCALSECREPFVAGERIFQVTEMPDGAYVCHRHEPPRG